jgi:predicted PurR-regulated permease PerM
MSQIIDPNPPASTYRPQWTFWHRQLATVLLIILGVYAVSLLTPVINMLILAIMLAFLLFVPSRTLAQRARIPYALAVILMYLLLIIIIVVVLLVVIPSLINSVAGLLTEIQQAYTEAARSLQLIDPDEAVIVVIGQPVDISEIVRQLQALTSAPRPVGINPSDNLTDPLRLEQAQLGQLVNQAIGVVASVTGTLASAISSVTGLFSTLGLALFISFLILLDMPITARSVAHNIPANYRREYSLLVAKILHVWNGFFRGQLIIGLMIGLLTWAQLRLMGINNPELLAVITGLISLIPTIGGIIALIPLGIVPFFQGSSVMTDVSPGLVAFLVVVVNLIISQVIWNVIAPKILGDALDLPLPVIIVGVFIGAAAGGALGAFLVAPIMGTFKVVLQYVLAKIAQRDPYPGQDAPFDWDRDLLARPRRPIKIWLRTSELRASRGAGTADQQ